MKGGDVMNLQQLYFYYLCIKLYFWILNNSSKYGTCMHGWNIFAWLNEEIIWWHDRDMRHMERLIAFLNDNNADFMKRYVKCFKFMRWTLKNYIMMNIEPNCMIFVVLERWHIGELIWCSKGLDLRSLEYLKMTMNLLDTNWHLG